MPLSHADLVSLIRDGIGPPAGAQPPRWADLGSGGGAFTVALAELLPAGAVIHSVDRDGGALRRQRPAMAGVHRGAGVEYVEADFTRPLGLPPLDGVLMANSLHFVRRKPPVLELVRASLRPGGRLLLVEYDSDRGNPWVPHPLAYASWVELAGAAGFLGTRLLARVPSRVLGAIYSALSLNR